MLKVYLHGNLGKTFGKKWNFDVDTPMDAFKAIDANTKGFIRYLAQKDREGIAYNVWFENGPITSKELQIDISSKRKMHIVPVIKGSDTEMARDMRLYGGAGILGGLALDFLGDMLGGILGDILSFIGTLAIEIGAALLIQGLIGALQDEPDDVEPARAKNMKSSASFIFGNPTNNVIQGARVPIGYGRLRVGSHVISSSVLNSRLVDFNEVQKELAVPEHSSSTAVKSQAAHVVQNR